MLRALECSLTTVYTIYINIRAGAADEDAVGTSRRPARCADAWERERRGALYIVILLTNGALGLSTDMSD